MLDITAEKLDAVDRRGARARHCTSDRHSARRHARPPDAETWNTEVAVVVRNIAKSLYASAASPAGHRQATVTLEDRRAAYSTRSSLDVPSALTAAESPPHGPCAGRIASAGGRSAAGNDSLLTRPCLFRACVLPRERRAHGPVGALVHFGPAAPARHFRVGLAASATANGKASRSDDSYGTARLDPCNLSSSQRPPAPPMGSSARHRQTTQLLPDSKAGRRLAGSGCACAVPVAVGGLGACSRSWLPGHALNSNPTRSP